MIKNRLLNEDVVEKQVTDLLDSLIQQGKPIYYWRSNAGKVWTIGNPKTFIETIFGMAKQGKSLSEIMSFAWKNIRSILLAPGGHPDFTACISGEFVGIETKRMKGGKHSEAQKIAQKTIEAAGGVYLLCNTAAPLREYLKKKGLLF